MSEDKKGVLAELKERHDDLVKNGFIDEAVAITFSMDIVEEGVRELREKLNEEFPCRDPSCNFSKEEKTDLQKKIIKRMTVKYVCPTCEKKVRILRILGEVD